MTFSTVRLNRDGAGHDSVVHRPRAFFAWGYERTERHDRAREVFDAVRAGDLPYRPLYTSRPVLSERAALMLRKVGHAEAVETRSTIREFQHPPGGRARVHCRVRRVRPVRRPTDLVRGPRK